MATDKYHILYLAGVDAFPDTTKKKVQQDINLLWSEIKRKEKSYGEELKKLKLKATKTKDSLLKFWTSRPAPVHQPTPTTSRSWPHLFQ